jgi:hypothetical protein
MDLLPKEYKKGGDIISPSALNNNHPPNPAAAPSRAGNINISKPIRRSFDYLKFGIIGGAIFFVLILLGWGGMKFYQRSLNANIEDLKKQEAGIFTDQDKVEAEKIAGLEKRADVTQTFLKSHIYSSVILDSIAALTLPRVKWDDYQLSVDDQKVSLKGEAADYSVLAKQIFTLDQTDYTNVAVSNISLNKNGTVNFSVDFSFNPKILQKQ